MLGVTTLNSESEMTVRPELAAANKSDAGHGPKSGDLMRRSDVEWQSQLLHKFPERLVHLAAKQLQ